MTATAKITANRKLKAYYQGRRKLAAKWKAANLARAAKWQKWIAHFDTKITACDHRIAALQAARVPSVMFDSVTLSAIPRDAPAVAGYVAGRFPTWLKLAVLFPRARRLSIAVASTQNADCLDIEPGDSTPQLAPGWVKRQQARGLAHPKVYASRNDMPQVLHALAAAGIPRAAVRVWSAHFNFTPHICGPHTCGASFQADGTQWTDKALGRNLDQSLLAPSFWE